MPRPLASEARIVRGLWQAQCVHLGQFESQNRLADPLTQLCLIEGPVPDFTVPCHCALHPQSWPTAILQGSRT